MPNRYPDTTVMAAITPMTSHNPLTLREIRSMQEKLAGLIKACKSRPAQDATEDAKHLARALSGVRVEAASPGTATRVVRAKEKTAGQSWHNSLVAQLSFIGPAPGVSEGGLFDRITQWAKKAAELGMVRDRAPALPGTVPVPLPNTVPSFSQAGTMQGPGHPLDKAPQAAGPQALLNKSELLNPQRENSAPGV